MINNSPHRQRLALPILIAILLCVATGQSQALTREQRADQYLLKAQEAYKEGKHREAVESFSRIESLGVSMPSEFHFFYGSSLAEIDDYESAYTQLSRYLQLEGRGGRQYQNALSLHGEMEQKIADNLDRRQNEVRKSAREWKVAAIRAGINPDKVSSPGTQESQIQRLRSQGKLLETISLIKENLKTHERLIDRAERLGAQFESFHHRNSRLQQAVERDLVANVNSNLWQDRADALEQSLVDGKLDQFEKDYNNWNADFDNDYQKANRELLTETERLETDLRKTAEAVHQRGNCRQLESQLSAWRNLGNDTSSIQMEIQIHDCR